MIQDSSSGLVIHFVVKLGIAYSGSGYYIILSGYSESYIRLQVYKLVYDSSYAASICLNIRFSGIGYFSKLK